MATISPDSWQGSVAASSGVGNHLEFGRQGLGLRPTALHADTLLVEADHYDTLRPMFGPRVTRLVAAQGPAYRIRGGYRHTFPRILANTTVHFVSQEFGTYKPTQVLHALREENRWQHYGDGGVDHPTKRKLKERFGPEDDLWRHSVLTRGKELLQQATELAFTGQAPR